MLSNNEITLGFALLALLIPCILILMDLAPAKRNQCNSTGYPPLDR